MHIFWIFCVLLGLFIQSSFTHKNDFDLLVFSQQWIKSSCMKPERSANKCIVPNHDHWTIHGIWPSKYRKKEPVFCSRDLPFRVTELDSIRGALEIKWSSMFDKNPEKFWKYEFVKHGTCAVVLNSLNTTEKYFRKALELNYLYNIKYMLDKSNIIPGRSYSITQIFSAVIRELGVLPQIACIEDKEKNQYIEEVRLCFNKKLRPISCKIHSTNVTDCDTRKLVKYPSRFMTSMNDDACI